MQNNLVEFDVHPQEIEGTPYPRTMYHRKDGTAVAASKDEEQELISRGYSIRYQHQEFPKMLYSADGKSTKKVHTEKELKTEQAKGWLTTPVKRPIWDTRAPEPGFNIVQHHLEYLQSNGFELKTVDEARAWFNALQEDAKDAFLVDAENWIAPEGNKKRA